MTYVLVLFVIFSLMNCFIRVQVLVNLDEGLGVSLVNKVPEELVFTTLSGIDVHFTRTAANEVLELSIQNIQVSSGALCDFRRQREKVTEM